MDHEKRCDLINWIRAYVGVVFFFIWGINDFWLPVAFLNPFILSMKFKSPESAEAILSLFVVYYNFIRVHQGINKTPIEEAGVNLNLGKNKWLDLIYNASQKN